MNMTPYPLISKLARELKRAVVVIDLESTGFLEPGVAIVELGYVSISPGGTVKREAVLVNPGFPIPESATAVHRITDKMVSQARDYPSLHAWVSTIFEKHVVAGFNSRSFDVGVLQACMARYGLPICEPEIQLDVRDIWIDVKGTQRGKLAVVAQAYGVEAGTAHRADGDAITAAGILEAMLWQHGAERVMAQLVQRSFMPSNELVATP